MSASLAQRRADYERKVRALRLEADAMLAQGASEGLVAGRMVGKRNALKAAFRVGLDPAVLSLIEARNTAKYGDPLGPSAPYLYRVYGSWAAVIAAACRPADLRQDGSARIFAP